MQEARANLSMIYLQLGEDKKAEEGLREILLNCQNARTRFGAAYNLAISLRKQGRYARARFYARQAMQSAAKLRDASAQAGCRNLLGNILMNQSLLDEALLEYRKALAIRRRQGGDVRFSIAMVLDNIGYTYLLQKKFRRGAAMIHRALALADEVSAKRSSADCCQDLCYAYMQMGRLDEADRFGRRALAISEANGYSDIAKNCFYLLGETAHLAGDVAQRDGWFGRLQEMHPELPFLRDFLCTFDLSGILTLKH
jgi:tetratricopeptide (TPR) repeat protein